MTVTESAPKETQALVGGAKTSGERLYLPLPPTFDTVEEERMHRKVRLAAAFRMFSKAGLDEGVAGHITARDPEFPDSYWVNPFGHHFGLMKQSDLVRVNHLGEVVEGNRAVNGAAIAIHCAVHAARPDVIAAAHAHGLYGKTLSALDMTIEPLTQDCVRFLQRHRQARQLHRRRARLRGRPAHRRGARPAQGRHPGQPRHAHRR